MRMFSCSALRVTALLLVAAPLFAQTESASASGPPRDSIPDWARPGLVRFAR